MKQSIESGLPVRSQVLIVARQEEPVPFEGPLPRRIKFPLLFSAQALDRLIHESQDGTTVKDDLDMRQDLAHGAEVCTAHVHGDDFTLPVLSGKLFEKGADLFLPFPFHRMKGPAGAQVGNDRPVLMPFPDAELINPKVAHLLKRDAPIEETQCGFMDVFDQVPAHSKATGNPAEGPEAERIQNREGKGTHLSMFSHHERRLGPSRRGTIRTPQTRMIKDRDTLLAPKGAHEKPPGLPPFLDGFAATPLGTPDQSVGHLGARNHRIGTVVSRGPANTLQPQSMVRYRRGHGLFSLPVRWVSNKLGSCCVHSLFFNPGVLICRMNLIPY